MSRGALVRFLLVLGLLAGCLALALDRKPNLGLDLRGGAQFVFQAEGTETTEATSENVDKTVEVLRGRVDALGVAESTLIKQGDDRILVELPGVTNDEEAAEAEERIGQTAQLSVHPVIALADSPDAEPSKKDNQVLPDEDGSPIEIGPSVLQGDEITGADAVQRENEVGWAVSLEFNGTGADAWEKLTAEAACAPPVTPSGARRSSSTARSSPHRASSPTSDAKSASPAAAPTSPVTSPSTARPSSRR
ncbi:preprotein translocase subunit SecD [Nocardioides piscis]|uniref:preprotein translocase subunit SecD n=1 Tax=Nocardioides piscis TaxID=2714938 RepID=UPI001FEBE4E9|nr:hypothetical protein [Nocardioides piscis]